MEEKKKEKTEADKTFVGAEAFIPCFVTESYNFYHVCHKKRAGTVESEDDECLCCSC